MFAEIVSTWDLKKMHPKIFALQGNEFDLRDVLVTSGEPDIQLLIGMIDENPCQMPLVGVCWFLTRFFRAASRIRVQARTLPCIKRF